MDTKRVLILTYYWPPSGGAGVQRWLKFAKYLPDHGVMPTIITVDPRKASYPVTDHSLSDEVPADIKVIRTNSFEPLQLLGKMVGKKQVPHAGFSNVNTQSLLQRILRFVRGNFFIPDARVGWNRYAYKAAKKEILHQKFDAVITTGPPHSTHLVGLKLKKKLGVKWIADFRDPWTDIYYYNQLMHLPMVKRRDLHLEKLVLEKVDKVIANCPSNRALLLHKLSSNYADKFVSITNGYDDEDFNNTPTKPEVFTLTYVGTISERYEPEVVFEALEMLLMKGVDFRFRVVGSLAPALVEQIKNRGLYDYFELIDYVPHLEAIKYMQSSSALLYLFPKTKNDKGIAGKLFEYLAAGVPIIAFGPKDGDSAAVLQETKAGRMFGRDESQEVLAFLIDIMKGYTDAINMSAQIRYSRQELSANLASLL